MLRGSGPIALLVTVLLMFAVAVPVVAADKDKDGLRDGFERKYGVTSPRWRDTDRDGVVDSAEDNDGDGLSNLGEQRFGTNPRKRDTDGDGRIDSREDANRNGITNGREQDRRRVPANLKPSLSTAGADRAAMRSTCHSDYGDAAPLVCKFGPWDAPTQIALIGDSHASMWSTSIKRVSVSKGWRLRVFTKRACPPLVDLYDHAQLEIDGGTSCDQWRHNVIDRLVADPPDLIVIAFADTYGLWTESGTKVAKSDVKATWKTALRRTLQALPDRSNVLILGGVPVNDLNPLKCLRHNRSDMSRCVTRRSKSGLSSVEVALRKTARANGAELRALHSKICSYDPCPVVQGHILVWRDRTHVTDTFAKQLQPTIRTFLERALK